MFGSAGNFLYPGPCWALLPSLAFGWKLLATVMLLCVMGYGLVMFNI